jgi:crossover junction endodeoxyribonuclease RuvC
MVMLGIDPGFRFAGFGIIKKEKRKSYLLDYGCLKMSSKQSIEERIGIFHNFFAKKISLHEVSDIALETPFLGKNAQNFLKLGYLRGILYLLADKNNILLHEFSPRQIKQHVTGFGGASKEQVARVLLQFFPKLNIERDDTSDAIAITLCGVWKKNLPSFYN